MAAEAPATVVDVEGHRLRLTSLDKVLYPATETTKGEILHYYTEAAPRLLGQLKARPVTRVRYPHGVTDLKFFEKNAPAGTPRWVSRVLIDAVDYPLVGSTADLIFFANLSSLEFHTPQWRTQAGAAETPDRLVMDLDPGAPAGLDECARVALILHDLFDSLRMASVAVTSGSKGMQVYAGLNGSRTSDEARELARSIAERLSELQPDLVVAKMTKSLRTGKVFIDWSQNTGFKTTITPWSLRGRNVPTVATPRTWQEIAEGAENPGSLEQLQFDEVLSSRLQLPDPMNALTH